MDDLMIQDAVYSCPECGGEITYLDITCVNCNCELAWGAESNLPVADTDIVICGECGREVQKNAKFCGFCGSAMAIDGFIDDDTERILPKCPQCGERIDYGASYCDACGSDIEWASGNDLLVDLSAFKEKEVIPRKNKPRVQVQYKPCTLQFDSFRNKLNPRGRFLKSSGYYAPPVLQYNSFGIYSG